MLIQMSLPPRFNPSRALVSPVSFGVLLLKSIILTLNLTRDSPNYSSSLAFQNVSCSPIPHLFPSQQVGIARQRATWEGDRPNYCSSICRGKTRIINEPWLSEKNISENIYFTVSLEERTTHARRMLTRLSQCDTPGSGGCCFAKMTNDQKHPTMFPLICSWSSSIPLSMESGSYISGSILW